MKAAYRFSVIVTALVLLLSLNTQGATTVPVVIKVVPGANVSLITNLLGGTVIDAIPDANTYLLRLPSLPALSTSLQLLGVQWIEQDRGVSLPKAWGFPLVNLPGNSGSTWYSAQPSLELIRSNAALEYATGSGVIIADINSRVDYSHPALAGHLGAGYDFVANRPTDVALLNDDQSTAGFLDDDQSTAGFLDDDQSTAGFLDDSGISLSAAKLLGSEASDHGTFCAGILAVVAPSATIMPLRAFDDNGNSDLFTLAKAIRYARRNGAQVLNMSFGTLSDARVLREAIDDAKTANLVMVTSAGNNNTSAPQYPAAYPGVIAVAATDLLDHKASFSNYGAFVFVDAPGSHIISATPGAQYGIANGTSFSAPMVAGMAALIRSTGNADTTSTIAQSTIPIDSRNPGYSGQLGYGRIDILNAVKP